MPNYSPRMNPHSAAALAIFALTYFVIAVGKLPFLRIDRTGAALAGALAMVAAGVLSESAAVNAVDFHTIVLLLGMMIVVANLRLSGAFQLFTRALLDRAETGYGLLAMTVAAAGVLAAFFINDVVCLALTPLLIDATEIIGAEPLPFLLALATASNIGSAATITGNPQNMIVAGFAHLGYTQFAVHLAPSAILGLVIDFAILAIVYRRSLGRLHRKPDAEKLAPPLANRSLMIKSLAVAIIALGLFVAGYPTHLVAMGAGVVLLFTRQIKPARVYELIDWTMLAMFTGLFIVVAGFQTTGLQDDLIGWAGTQALTNSFTLSAVVALLSNLVSNVPAVLLFRPLYPLLGGTRQIALVIAGASTMAGNLTILGSMANLIVVEQARARGVEISFGEYLRAGLPIAIVTLVLNAAILSVGL
ncbi:MAG: SLC13 family permease [Candidatus Binataceae bacterium]